MRKNIDLQEHESVQTRDARDSLLAAFRLPSATLIQDVQKEFGEFLLGLEQWHRQKGNEHLEIADYILESRTRLLSQQ